MEKIKQRAVTLVETVVSMTLVIIVASFVFVTCSFTIKIQTQNKIKHFFVGETENVAMCFYSDDPEKALSFLTDNNVVIEDDTSSFSIYYSSELTYSNEEEADYKLEVNFENPEGFSILCTSLQSGKTLYSYGGANEK